MEFEVRFGLVSRFLALFVVFCAFAGTANAQTGASEDRVSLPEGPGSLEGVGENVEIDPNMGMMRYNVGISVPKGFPMATPALSLGYSSGGGTSVVGMGWSMATPHIERMTYRKLPLYTPEDDFCVDGSGQLIRQPDTEPPVYRSRYEKGFIRYTWLSQGDGAEGYWLAETPDGTRSFYGADALGVSVPSARVGDPSLGTFRYHLVEQVDVYGHSIRYTYEKFGHYALVTHIGYVFEGEGPTYEIAFDYEDRSDVGGVDHVSDGAPGFELLLTQRMTRIEVFSRGVSLRRYELAYEPYRSSGGFTRLTQVALFGRGDEKYPTTFDFEYSRTLAGVCEGDDCQQPFMMDMGSLGVNMQTGQTTLLDINGDALPDILDTSQDGAHRFFLNIADADGSSRFDTEALLSGSGIRGSHNLSEPATQVLDVNGDGFTDLINAATGNVLLNRGLGDWDADRPSEGVEALAEALVNDFDGEDGDFQTLKFIDYNNDKLIDVMRSTTETTTVFRNMGAEGFEVDEGVEAIGAGFAEDGLQLADMNGDGLLDVVRLRPQTILYKLNLGWGQWGDWVEITDLPINEAAIESEFVELEDINGDGLADIVVVQGQSVVFALNTNTRVFSEVTTLSSEDIEGSIPERFNTTVLYADMNGNGSSDIVWIDNNGRVQALELFPIRPNLMSQVTNDLGQVTKLSYSTGAVQMALDGGWESWAYKLPFPMLVVSQMNQSDLHSNLEEVTEYRYHDGFYDGDEKQFRGFARTEILGEGDDFHEDGLVEMRYDVGAEDAYRNGLLLGQTTWSDGRELEVSETTYDDCPVAEISDDLEFPVRYICPVATRTILKEGLSEDRWIITETASEYDGYRNITLSSDFGVTSIGGQGCEPCNRPDEEFGRPCGPQCLGDESYTQTSHVSPDNTGGRWIISKPFRVRTFGRPNSPLFTEKLTYYDGNDFEGRPLGFLEQGKATRTTVKIFADRDDVLTATRQSFDGHGNPLVSLEANAEIGGNTHQTIYTYDDAGLRVIRTEDLHEDDEGPYRLRRDFEYEAVFDRLISSTRNMIVRDGAVLTDPDPTLYLYDDFGRITGTVLPGGDTIESPSEVYEYDMGNPVSRIIVRRRSEVGGPLDLEEVACFDGRGRKFQTLTKVADDLWQSDGFQIFNVRSQPLRAYQPYYATSNTCDLTPPEGVLFVETRHDALNREVLKTIPDESIYGTSSLIRTEYEPLLVRSFDAEDTDPNSPHKGTPHVQHLDGLKRVVSVETLLSESGPAALTETHFDGLGRVIGFTDDQGNRKVQDFDLLGRPISVEATNADGVRVIEFDDNGNVVREEDERGVIVRSVYDGQNRPLESFEEGNREATLITWIYDTPEDCPEDRCTHTAGLLAEVSYPGIDGGRAAEFFGYDARDNLVYRARRVAGHTFDFHFVLDNVDRQIETAFPDGQTLNRSYDGKDRLTAVEGYVHTIAYDARGLMSEASCADGSGLQVTYDAMLRPATRQITGAGGGLLAGWGFEYDRNSNPLVVEDLAQGDLPRGGRYTYDAWYRLTQAVEAPDTPQQEALSYTNDTISNFTARTSSLGADSPVHVESMIYGADGPNAVSNIGAIEVDYDAAGHMVERGALSMTWDHHLRLTEVSDPNGELQRNVYDSEATRLVKREDGSTSLYVSADFIVRDGISELYVAHANKNMVRIESDALAAALLDDMDEDGQIGAADALLSHTEGDDSVPALWSSVRRLMIETGPDGGVAFIHSDHRNSSILSTGLVDGEAKVLGERRFYPYGGLYGDATGFVDVFGYTGKERDAATGFDYFGARFYDPLSGRWISPDPAFAITSRDNLEKSLVEATTAYSHVMSNPVANFDPDGNITINFLPSKRRDSAIKGVLGDRTYVTKGSKRLDYLKGGTHTLRVVGHGNMGSSIGSHVPFDKKGPKELVRMLKKEGLSPGAYDGLTISLIACNSGSHVKSTFGKPTAPYAERFAKALASAGFSGVTVEGFSGFVDNIGGSGYRSHDHWAGAKVGGTTKRSDEMKVSYSVTEKGVSAGVGKGKGKLLSPSKWAIFGGGKSKVSYLPKKKSSGSKGGWKSFFKRGK